MVNSWWVQLVLLRTACFDDKICENLRCIFSSFVSLHTWGYPLYFAVEIKFYVVKIMICFDSYIDDNFLFIFSIAHRQIAPKAMALHFSNIFDMILQLCILDGLD